MSAYWSSVEGQARAQRAYGQVKPVERPRGPQALTFLFTLLQPVTFAFLSTIQEQPMHAATRKHPYRPSGAAVPESTPPSPPLPHPGQLENVFIDALVQACACQKHIRASPVRSLLPNSTHLYHRARRRCLDSRRQVRHLHRCAIANTRTLRTSYSREDYMGMLDWYREPFSTEATSADSEPFRLPSRFEAFWPLDRYVKLPEARSEHPIEPLAECRPEQPKTSELSEPIVLSEPSETSNPQAFESSEPSEPSETLAPQISEPPHNNEPEAVTNLLKILEDSECTHEAAFEAYSVLPFPGVCYLSDQAKRLLFHRLSVMKKKTRDAMLRYLSVVDDMKSADFPMTEAEWNSAMAFCGQCFARITAADLESALRTWKEMEQEAAVRSGNVTFNILFDMAAKAGKFVLAEMILKEMEARKLGVSRYARVSYIFYQGLRADGDGVRKAYREFVEAGEIVDTVVLNCVIASLIRAGEPAAAEQVYQRMKRMLAKHTGQTIPYLDWRETRHLGRLLDKAARNFKHDAVKLQQLRDEQVLAPDLHTFAILLEHHVSNTGEFGRMVAVLTEMQHVGVPMNGRIFLKIFKGFASHGGRRLTSWTKGRLESVWNALLEAMKGGDDVKITKWTVIWVVRAFECCASRDRTLEVWGELRSRWEPDDFRQIESAMSVLSDILKVD